MDINDERTIHFIEYLKHSQGKEPVIVPEDVVNQIAVLLIGCNITFNDVKKCISNSSNNKWKENSPQIYKRITGCDAVTVTYDQESKIMEMFRIIRDDFPEAVKKVYPMRTSFFSFVYLMNYICERLGYNDLTLFFTPLKGEGKRASQDKIMEEIFKKNDWEPLTRIIE